MDLDLDIEYTFALLSIFDISILTLTFISSFIIDTFLQMVICATNCRIQTFVDIWKESIIPNSGLV